MKIIYKTANGIAVIHPSPHWKGTMQELVIKDAPKGCNYRIVEDSVVPTDRTFRNAWEWDLGDLRISLTKAKEIKKEHLRKDRKPLLESLDIEFMRATEGDLDTYDIVKEKQRLRDITKQVDEIEDLETLKTLTCEK